MNTTVQKIIKYVLPLVVLVMGIAGAVTLVKSRPQPKRSERVDHGVLVDLEVAQVQTKKINITAQGTVMPADKVVLQPQVSGAVVWVSEKLVAGGLVEQGEPLIRIDRRDYEIALQQRKATVAQAEAQLRIEEGQQRVAQREWELFKQRTDEATDASLALRAPQQRIAEVNVESAKAGSDKAKLDLDRTVIRAPFNAYIQSENVAMGQTVSPQNPLATLIGTDHYWVQISVPVDKLPFIQIPLVNATEGAPATVTQQNGAERVVRTGRVLRLLPEVDALGRMARVLAEIDDPMHLAQPVESRGVPLLMGAIVSVELAGRDEAQVAVVPRSAVHDGSKIWAVQDNALQIREIEVVWGDEETV
ncbi:MAG: efflux RND transporter periplasmic adaptor subunit [bacterium]